MAKIFQSILFPDGAACGDEAEASEIFGDLNLDQIIDAVTAGKEDYDLKPFFRSPLGEIEAILYRQGVMRDLEDARIRRAVDEFAAAMRRMRAELVRSEKLTYRFEKEWWFVDAVELYCRAVGALANDLAEIAVASEGFRGLRGYLAEYVASGKFRALAAAATRLRKLLAATCYSLIIKDDSLSVRQYDGEADYSSAVEQTFRKFAQGEGKDYRVQFREPKELNHIEAAALDFVARLNPDLFADLDRFAATETDYLDETIRRFDREVQFYLSWLGYIGELEATGLAFSIPSLASSEKRISVKDGFDLALARKLAGEGGKVVCNDVHLKGAERIIVVSGPNNGGKTTFARMFGQLHYLVRLGCKVPGREVQLFLSDRVFTHFEREEKVENLKSKLEEELVRVRRILERASGRSIVVMNESFSSTGLEDAVCIGKKVMQRIIGKDVIALFVTFVEELARLGDSTVSMVSTIVPGDPALRTYKILRQAADGRAYAIAVAEKYGLTYRQLRERIGA